MYSIFFDEINTKMYPSGMLHKFGVNGKVSGSVGAAGEIQGDIMIMLHGAEGCAYHYRNSARRRHQPFYDILSSDLTDRDIVYGGIEKLKRSVRDAWERYSPELIIIVPTPVSDVLSDDIITCAEELRGEGINCISVQSELFSHRDKNYAKRRARELARQSLESDETLEIELNGCGFTELLYALVGQVMEKQPVIPHSVNIETVGWGSEGKQVLREIGDFLGKCGVTVNTWIPSAKLEDIKRAPAAQLNIVKRIRWARRMRDLFGTEYMMINDTGKYEGLSGITAFYRDVAKRLDMEDIFNKVIWEEVDGLMERTADVREKLHSHHCTLVCRGFQSAPYRVKLFAKEFGLPLDNIIIILNDDMRRDVDMTRDMEEAFMAKIKAACELYSPDAVVSVNPGEEELRLMLKDTDAIVGTDDFHFEGYGAPLVPAMTEMTSLSYESYERNLKRLLERIENGVERRQLIISRMDFSENDYQLYNDRSLLASREMWKRMWLEKGGCEQ